MSLNIKLKHSAVANKKPQVADLQPGELALNINNASLAGYALDDASAVQQMFGKATETQEGQAEIATQGEVDAGTDDERIVTPAKLNQRITDYTTNTVTPAVAAEQAARTAAIAAETAARTAADDLKVDKAGDTMTGDLNLPNLTASGNGTFTGDVTIETGKLLVNGSYFQVFPTGGTGAGMEIGTCPNNGMFVVGDIGDPERLGGIRCQVSAVGSPNLHLSRKSPSVSGDKYIQFAKDGSVAGSVTVLANNSVKYNTSSDYRLKENVKPIAGAIDRFNRLNPCSYNYISNPEIPMLGFLAHEVAEVFPSVVTGEKDAVDEKGNPEYQQIDYGMLTPILTAALQEALARIEALEAKV